MPGRKIAPTLRRAHPRPLSARDMAQGRSTPMVTYRADDAWRELTALLAVAAAARRCALDYDEEPYGLHRALSRLDRASAPEPMSKRRLRALALDVRPARRAGRKG